MPPLTKYQRSNIVDLIIDEHGSGLTGYELSEVIGLILEDISGFETMTVASRSQVIKTIRSQYYEYIKEKPNT